MSRQAENQIYDSNGSPPSPTDERRGAPKQHFVAELSQCLYDFVIQLLPTSEEMAVKEDVRKLLERLIRTIEPNSRLLSFGSSANGFSLRNSDMDLCCLLDSKERVSATDLVTMLGDLLERETKFHVKPLPHARIPIVKLSLDPSPGLPLGIACDIGFENRLALENTRLLMCYAMVDPTRVRTMVLFLKVWSKRRKINSPYQGTLSSYGYVLLVIYFLVHVKNPPVLPNLQQIPPLRPISKEDTHLGGHNIWFFDDIDLLRQKWISSNTDSVAELLIDFFRYYSRDFVFNTGVASIRAGLLKKESKGWQNNLSSSKYNDLRERNRLCIEDPFETDYNVARCVTRDGLYNIRGELMRASRILASRPERAVVALAELCEERKEVEVAASSQAPFVPPRLSLPPQTPYTVGSASLRPKGAPEGERLSPPATFFEPGHKRTVLPVTIRPPPEHMAPKRSKWTSPPPPGASESMHSQFEHELDKGLELATTSTEARESTVKSNSNDNESVSWSSGNSEQLTDDELPISEMEAESDFDGDGDARSIRSYTEGSSNSNVKGRSRTMTTTSPMMQFSPMSSARRPMWLQMHAQQQTAMRVPTVSSSAEFEAATGGGGGTSGGVSVGVAGASSSRGGMQGNGKSRLPPRMLEFVGEAPPSTFSPTAGPSTPIPNIIERTPTPLRTDFVRRQPSGSSRSPNRFSWAGSPGSSSQGSSSHLLGANQPMPKVEQATVFYQTSPTIAAVRSPKMGFGSPVVGSHSPLSPHYAPPNLQQLQQAQIQLQQAQFLQQQQFQLQHVQHLHAQHQTQLGPSLSRPQSQQQQRRSPRLTESHSSAFGSHSLSPPLLNLASTSRSPSPSLGQLCPSPKGRSPSLSQLSLQQDPAIVEVSPNRYTFTPGAQGSGALERLETPTQAGSSMLGGETRSPEVPPLNLCAGSDGRPLSGNRGASLQVLESRLSGCDGLAGGSGPVVGFPTGTSDDSPSSPSSPGHESSFSRSPPSVLTFSSPVPASSQEPQPQDSLLPALGLNLGQPSPSSPGLVHGQSPHSGVASDNDENLNSFLANSVGANGQTHGPLSLTPPMPNSTPSPSKRIPLPVTLEPSLRRAIGVVIGKGQMRAELPAVSLNER